MPPVGQGGVLLLRGHTRAADSVLGFLWRQGGRRGGRLGTRPRGAAADVAAHEVRDQAEDDGPDRGEEDAAQVQ